MAGIATLVPVCARPESELFSAVVRFDDGRIDVVLRGELDLATAPVLVAAVAPMLCLVGCSIELDARELSFLDASGIDSIVRIRCVLRGRGGELAMRSAPPLARRVLAICGLSDLLADPQLLDDAAGAMMIPVLAAATRSAVTIG